MGVATTYNVLVFIVDFILHIDVHLGELISRYGTFVYVILFGIIFVETGVVIMPFLPGDSLLFAAGAFSALGSLQLPVTLAVLAAAAVIGDTVNYWIGHFFGEKLIANPRVPINQNHIDQTNKFFEKHGGKTIILARFVPIVRTFAPFVAGIGKMRYSAFISYNIIGGIAWVLLFTLAGYFFGQVPFVKHNFSLVIIAIILLSVAPIMFELVKSKLNSHRS